MKATIEKLLKELKERRETCQKDLDEISNTILDVELAIERIEDHKKK